MNKYEITSNQSVITVLFDDISAGWEQYILLRSDIHHDNVYCRRDIEYKHLDEAIKREALICDFGDTIDAMQGKFDPRRSYDELRPEYKGEDYYDRVVCHTATEYKDYANNWLMFSRGNHEVSVRKHAGTDILSNLVFKMNTENKAQILTGEYGGWIRFRFTLRKTVGKVIRLKYHHGTAGTSAPVTRGTIDTNRQAVYLPDADIVINGHIHQSYIIPIARERLSEKGKVYRDLVWFGRIPGYKDDWVDGSKGWGVEKGQKRGPTPLGSLWLRFSYDGNTINTSMTAEVE